MMMNPISNRIWMTAAIRAASPPQRINVLELMIDPSFGE
jgi:hypothetical protein